MAMGRPRDLAFVTTFGLGFMRPAPGTWGSIPTVVVAGLLIAGGHGPAESPWVYHIFLLAWLALFAGVCVVGGDRAEGVFGRKDPSQVVADETAGQVIPLLAIPAGALQTPVLAVFTLVLAFLAFRVMDIFKPWPAGRLQRLAGGWGILMDDLVAGIYALVVVQVCFGVA